MPNPYNHLPLEALDKIAKQNGLDTTAVWVWHRERGDVQALANLLDFHIGSQHIKLETMMPEQNSALIPLLQNYGALTVALDKGYVVTLQWDGRVLRVKESEGEAPTEKKTRKKRTAAAATVPEVPTQEETKAPTNAPDKSDVPTTLTQFETWKPDRSTDELVDLAKKLGVRWSEASETVMQKVRVVAALNKHYREAEAGGELPF